jgi:hypothetical protein
MLTDVANSGDGKMVKKEAVKILKYTDVTTQKHSTHAM